jgi:hypothetical protein
MCGLAVFPTTNSSRQDSGVSYRYLSHIRRVISEKTVGRCRKLPAINDRLCSVEEFAGAYPLAFTSKAFGVPIRSRKKIGMLDR